MTEMCTALADRDEILIGYLYDEIDPAAREAFEAHMAACSTCRDEVDALRGVRRDLAQWTPEAVARHRSSVAGPPSQVGGQRRQTWWREIPAWAQVAAALLFLGVAAGLANLNIHYDSTGLTIHTGWKAVAIAAPPAAQSASDRADGVSRADLVALEQRLRGELRTLQTSGHAQSVDTPQQARTASADADVLRKVRGLVDDSEKRQQTELALRIGEVLRDIGAQRRADLVKIDRSLGLVENNLGVEVLKQRERVNYLMRANQSVPVR